MTETMGRAKYFFAIAAAAILALAMSVGTAWASTITVNNAVEGETYTVYKMLDLKVDSADNPQAYSYTVNEKWNGFFADSNSEVWGTIFEKDAQGYITAKDNVQDEVAWSASSALSAFAEAAAAYASDEKISPVGSAKVESTEDATAATATITTSDPGYYLITSSLGSRAMIDTTPGDVTINEKNDKDTIVKTVQEDSTGRYDGSNDAQVGDTVNFRSQATIVPRSVNVKIHDTMTEGLAFTAGSIKLYTDDTYQTELDAQYYTIENTPADGDTFTITISDSFAATAANSQVIYIEYSATLTRDAIGQIEDAETGETSTGIVDQKNQTTISYGDAQSVTSETTTTTHSFSVFKHARNSVDNLAGAVFTLKKNNDVIGLIKIDDNNYRVALENEVGAVNTFTTVASGDIVIWGVDADNDYALEETVAPAGYNKLADDVSVAVNAANSYRADIENNTGTELPSTGGMGTTILYVIGAVLVIGAGVFLITKRRVRKESIEE